MKSYMAHHQGMSLVALTNVLLDDLMPRRFHREPDGQGGRSAAPGAGPRRLADRRGSRRPSRPARERADPGASLLLSRRLTTPATAAPRTHLLSNTQYHVMVTNAGSGSSKCQGLDVTRWREDPTCEGMGPVLLRSRPADRPGSGRPGTSRSAGRPTLTRWSSPPTRPCSAGATADIETLLEITVSPEQLAEVRRITLTNHGSHAARAGADQLRGAVLHRPRRRPGPPGLRQAVPRDRAIARLRFPALPAPAAVRATSNRSGRFTSWRSIARPRAAPSWATSNTRPIGHGSWAEGARRPTRPRSARARGLSGTTGPVLDPVFSLRRRFRIEPGGSAVVGFTLALADSRDAALALADKYHGISAVARAFELAWAHSQVEHGHRNWSPEDAHLYQRLGSHLLFAGSALRAHSAVLAANRQAQPALWRCGISGDRPIVLARIAEGGRAFAWPGNSWSRTPSSGSRAWSPTWSCSTRKRADDADGLSEQLSNWSARPAATIWPNRPGGRLRAPQRGTLRGRCRSCSKPRPVSCSTERRGSSAGQLDRVEWGRSHAGAAGSDAAAGPLGRRAGLLCRPACNSPTDWAASPPMAASTACSFERPGLTARRQLNGQPGRATNPTPSCPRPLGQRRRQSRVRIPRLRGGLGIHLGRQQPDQPPDGLEQRPRRRPARRK